MEDAMEAIVPSAQDHGSLARAAQPVLDELARDLDGTSVAIVLTDARGDVVERRSGEPGQNARSHRLVDVATLIRATAAINGPHVGHDVGAIDLIGAAAESRPLLRALATRAARDVEQRLLDGTGVSDRLMIQRFLQERRRAKGPFVIVTEGRIVANAAAARLVDPSDEPVLRECAAQLQSGRRGDTSRLVLRGLEVDVTCEVILDGRSPAAALLRLRPVIDVDPIRQQRHGSHPTFGWDSLTDTERSVMELVTDGLTNREAAERLFMSRHTVGSHLRSIFAKLGVNSRVDLTRLVMVRRTHPSTDTARPERAEGSLAIA
jgi:DNA-binding CsgD family transcriptional regulator